MGETLTYQHARSLIRECDILLFKPQSLICRLWTRVLHSPYFHVALASWHNHILEYIEFNTRCGGETASLDTLMSLKRVSFDVYRPSTNRQTIYYNNYDNTVHIEQQLLHPRKITDRMRNLTGLPYGWLRIWWWITQVIPFTRLIYNMKTLINDRKKILHRVCASSVANCFSEENFDLVKQKADTYITPLDLSQSTSLNYLFTVTN